VHSFKGECTLEVRPGWRCAGWCWQQVLACNLCSPYCSKAAQA
jgi:hypothetical protein